MAIKKTLICVTTTGGSAVAGGTVNSDEMIKGWVEAVTVDYHGDAPGTTDVLLVQAHELRATNIINLANNKTDSTLYPRVALTDNTGGTLTYDGTHPVYGRYPVCDRLSLKVTGSDPLTDCVKAEIYWESEFGA